MKAGRPTRALGFKPLEKLRALYWAEVHIRECKTGCELIRTWNGSTISQELLYVLATGIVVSYCRSFVQHDGLSDVGTLFRAFRGEVTKGKLHEHLMRVRNIIFAHKDRLHEHEVLALRDHDELSKIHVIVKHDGSTDWLVKRGIPPNVTYFKDIEDLCDFQIERLHRVSSDMLGHFCKDKSYKPGTYTLGEGFP